MTVPLITILEQPIANHVLSATALGKVCFRCSELLGQNHSWPLPEQFGVFTADFFRFGHRVALDVRHIRIAAGEILVE
jgi:hypothetical protein